MYWPTQLGQRIHIEAQRKACCSSKPESGTLRQYFTGPIGVEYLVRGKN
jgi:hypothetical protein